MCQSTLGNENQWTYIYIYKQCQFLAMGSTWKLYPCPFQLVRQFSWTLCEHFTHSSWLMQIPIKSRQLAAPLRLTMWQHMFTILVLCVSMLAFCNLQDLSIRDKKTDAFGSRPACCNYPEKSAAVVFFPPDSCRFMSPWIKITTSPFGYPTSLSGFFFMLIRCVWGSLVHTY